MSGISEARYEVLSHSTCRTEKLHARVVVIALLAHSSRAGLPTWAPGWLSFAGGILLRLPNTRGEALAIE
jgi:hypothetical protein